MCSLNCELSISFRLVFKRSLHSFVYRIVGHPFEFDGLREVFGHKLDDMEYYPILVRLLVR